MLIAFVVGHTVAAYAPGRPDEDRAGTFDIFRRRRMAATGS